MLINQKGAVAVLEDKRPVGILTEKDIVEMVHRGIDLGERADKYAKKKLITVRGNRTIGYALNVMIEHDIRRLIVTDDANDFLGIITQKDLFKQLEDDFYRSTLKVKHIAEGLRYLIGVPVRCTLSEALEEMVENMVSAVPVMQDGKALGIITEKDILKIAAEDISLAGNVGRYMTTPLISVNLDADLKDVVHTMRHHDIRRVVVNNDEGIPVRLITIRDLLRSVESDYSEFLERKLRYAKDVFNLLPEMLIEVVDTGKEQLIIWANEKAIKKFGREIIDKTITEFIPEESWDEIYDALVKLNKIENIIFKNNNAVYELSGFFIKTEREIENGKFELVMRDITEETALTTTDPLTTIYNRRFINDFLKKETERSRRLHREFSVAMCDLDDLKIINDTYGHLSGDMVLKSFAQLIVNSLRKLDVSGRYGGDEFVIILPETDSKNARNIVDRLRLKIEESDIRIQGNTRINITASFGIATFPGDGKTADDLLAAADYRLYKAKQKTKKEDAGMPHKER